MLRLLGKTRRFGALEPTSVGGRDAPKSQARGKSQLAKGLYKGP